MLVDKRAEKARKTGPLSNSSSMNRAVDMVENEAPDTTKTREVPLMQLAEYDKGWALFKNLMMREPRPEEGPSREQMPVLVQFLKNETCSVDFSLWGFYQTSREGVPLHEFTRRPGGTLIRQVLNGAPGYAHWRGC